MVIYHLSEFRVGYKVPCDLRQCTEPAHALERCERDHHLRLVICVFVDLRELAVQLLSERLVGVGL